MERRGADRRRVDSLEAALALFAPGLAAARDERLHVAHLDRDHQLVGLRIRYGTELHQVRLTLRATIADALKLNSAGLLLAHNHPSGDPEPSAADLEATRSLIQVAKPLGVTVRDHLVFGGGRYVSFRERGLL